LFSTATSLSPVLDDPLTLTRNLIGLDAGANFVNDERGMSTFGKLVVDSMK
jgi:hypothetical protein